MTSDQAGDKGAKPAQQANLAHAGGGGTPPARLGGARADFVASLGKKVNDARSVLHHVQKALGSDEERAIRDDLRRRLHAVQASARLLRFELMSRALDDALGVIDRGAAGAGMSMSDVGRIAATLDDLPALAWGEPPLRGDLAREPREPRERPSSDPPADERAPLRTAVVVGPAMLAEALTDEELVPDAPPYECERTDDAQEAVGLARNAGPDVVVIDADVADAAELVEALLDDPLTEPVPIVVVGAFKDKTHAAKFVALGVARTLAKPITPELLRRACDESVDSREELTMRVTLGEPTLEQLGERLAEEVRRAIVDGAEKDSREVRVPLGEGTEVMSAVWGAIARVREVVSARTSGRVRFHAGPEGAIAVAPWLHPDVPATDRVLAQAGRVRGPAADVRLHGRRVIVADDDPGVTWFISDLLRTAGCVVSEALDGATALDLAYRTSPEIVISDILMPGMDGFALTRALKRDVALRDVPVILLSWKEDLLQRVRELGASAAAYLRKESDSRAIVARVRECLRPRARIEARLRADGEARGRLDGLTVKTLLELACAIRPDARVTIRDASFQYEVELREGAPRRVVRSAGDGSFERGDRVLASLLGVGAGRFAVTSSTAAIAPQDRDFSGSLAQIAARPLAVARAARSVLTGTKTANAERVHLDIDALPALLLSTPEPALSLVRALAEGASPRALLSGGHVDPVLLEDVLGDLASRGAIGAVWNAANEDLLAPAVNALMAPREELSERPVRRSDKPPSVASADLARAKAASRPTSKPPVPEADLTPPPNEDLHPSSLADAVMREISDRVPEARAPSSSPPPIVEPSALRPRSNPPSESQMQVTPIPPDAIVPAEEGHPSDKTEIDAPVGRPIDPDGHEERISATAEPLERSVSIPIDVVPGSDRERDSGRDVDPEPPSQATPLSAVSSAHEPRSHRGRTRRRSKPRWPWLAGIGAVATAVAIGLQLATPPEEASMAAAAAGVETAAAPVPVATAATTADVSYEAIPPGVAVDPGQGLILVRVSDSDSVRIDGITRGQGPVVRMPIAPGTHQVQATAVSRAVEVRAGRTARIDLTRP